MPNFYLHTCTFILKSQNESRPRNGSRSTHQPCLLACQVPEKSQSKLQCIQSILLKLLDTEESVKKSYLVEASEHVWKWFCLLRYLAISRLILQSTLGCLVSEESCRYPVQSIRIVEINCHYQSRMWICLCMSCSAETKRSRDVESDGKNRVFDMLYVKQKLIENMGGRHFESLFNYKEVKLIIKKFGSYILPTEKKWYNWLWVASEFEMCM